MAKIPMPLVSLIPLSLLVSYAWKEHAGSETGQEFREESLQKEHPVA
jgi:hypothetical protein